ncbi:DUF2624 family protein [Alteribacillus iranensis]|uniref:Uncharacterized protein n=1 Tax=Alteribacillus iranensis TaxID=930128 RepID=A0A1I1ZDK2_9BACI|nr:DUF2624 family protein [Alteribacillus iranensis]SFE29408.1 Protein of unknown function [Alteribacillus iranensis]
MNHFKDQWIKYKISELHPKDITHYGSLYGIDVSHEEAVALLHLVKTNQWSLDDKDSLLHLLHNAKKAVTPKTYQLLEKLFHEYIR